MTLAFGTIVLIMIVIAGSVSAGYFFYLGYQQNQPQTSVQTKSTSSTSQISQIDLTQKCADAGGICKKDCGSATIGSASGTFFDNLYAYLASLFSRTNSSATIGSVANLPQEIGIYPNFCTAQFPKCCEISASTSSTSTTSQTSSPFPTQVSSSAFQAAIDSLDSALTSAVNQTSSNIESILLGK